MVGTRRGVGGGRVLAALLLEGVTGAETIVMEALELTFGVAQGVRVVVVCDNNDLGAFLFRLYLRLVRVEYPDFVANLVAIYQG